MNDTKDLAIILEEKQIDKTQSKTLLDGFGDFFVQAHKLVAQAKGIKVTSEDQVEEMAKAKEVRLQLMKIRTDADKTRKVLKEGYLRGGQAVQDIYNDIRDITQPEEDRLKEQEKFAEIAEAKRVEARHTKRVETLSKYVEDVSVYSLRDMPDDVFNNLVSDCKKVYEQKLAEEKRAEEERIAREKAQELYNERKFVLAKFADFIDLSKLTPDTTTSEYEEMVSLAQSSKKAHEEKQEAMRLQNEKLQKEKEEAEKKRLAEEKKAQAKLEAIEKEKKEAEEKLQREREAQAEKERKAREAEEEKKRAEEEAAKKALLAPDKEKLAELVKVIDTIKFPAVSSKEAGDIIREANLMLDKVSSFIREKSKGL